MRAHILTENKAAISDLKNKPLEVLARGKGDAVAILSRNKPVFYAVPVERYEKILEQLNELLDDLECAKLIKARRKQPSVKVSLDEL